ncbi:unnamed protein product [Owenia fusiformis]|uniref:Uncharacterized protein n=1 Tax=Owenia fusiformis TaxID=6347 RepID=A0A8J1TWS4_OWEFU|nr:unnamed protein product [Owenia fusiformis]
MTVDRLLLLKFPLKKKLHSTRLVCIVVAILLIIVAARDSQMLFYTTAYYDTILNENVCNVYGDLDTMALPIWNSVMQSLIPFVILISCNSYILFKIKNPSEVTVGIDESTNPPGSESFKGRQINVTIMLFIVSFAVIVLNLPLNIMLYIAQLNYDILMRKEYFIILLRVSVALYFMNNAVNFYLCLLGGSRFRRDFRKLLMKLKICKCIVNEVNPMERVDGNCENNQASIAVIPATCLTTRSRFHVQS